MDFQPGTIKNIFNQEGDPLALSIQRIIVAAMVVVAILFLLPQIFEHLVVLDMTYAGVMPGSLRDGMQGM